MSVGQKGSTLALQLETQCKRRFENIEHNYTFAASTFLDIRFKNIVFCDTGNVENIKSSLVSEMRALHRQATTSEPSASATFMGTAWSRNPHIHTRKSSEKASPEGIKSGMRCLVSTWGMTGQVST
ncbi:hypothetical protein QTP70_007990 [Hemibagrus guttatus]|uniref:Uncharacterized protein n=1 Tax=Hemibagrus guttatus TaxID=175788 RepID=A0AAE0RHT0_9TELE|nr:hypothetical protein QTP70_007990 [Hemibagrus guttatus]KAK3574353.1 hypothetical protein QTP86_005148 [Hemibagrus guttatus]